MYTECLCYHKPTIIFTKNSSKFGFNFGHYIIESFNDYFIYNILPVFWFLYYILYDRHMLTFDFQITILHIFKFRLENVISFSKKVFICSALNFELLQQLMSCISDVCIVLFTYYNLF